MSDNKAPVSQVISDQINEIENGVDPQSMSVESLVLLVHTERLKNLEKKITKEFAELKSRQDQVVFLHKLQKAINSATSNEEFDCSKDVELQKLLKKAKEYGVDLKEDKFKYNKEERERLIENIKLTADDLTVLNDMQLQTITRLTTERYESYQLARNTVKPLHEDKIDKTRAIAGR